MFSKEFLGVFVMQLSSSAVALTLLRGTSTDDAAVAAKTATAKTSADTRSATSAVTDDVSDSSGVTYALSADEKEQLRANDDLFKMVQALAAPFNEARQKLLAGSVSPFDTEVVRASMAETTFRVMQQDSRMEFEGAFAAKFVDTGMGATQPQRDADFPSRSDAMAYAYHFATALAQDAQQAVTDMAWINANSDTTRDASGRIYGTNADGTFKGVSDEAFTHGTFDALWTFQSMERNAASLANLFSLDAASVTTSAYDGSFGGFSLSHGNLGKIMDVTADGAVTLYDAEGKGYSAAEYSAANIDGGIPQLRNDLIRQADRQSAAA